MKKNILAFMSVLLTVCIFFSLTVSAAATEDTYTFIVPGDVDCNKFLEIKDVTLMQKHLASVENITEAGLSVADYNGDGNSNILDATEIQKCLAGLEYNCVIKPQEYIFAEKNYLITDFSNCEIDFNIVFVQNNVFYNGDEHYSKEINTGISLITSKEQFFAFVGAYSPEFDDEFFEENALIIMIEKEGYYNKTILIKNLYVKDETLYLYASYLPSHNPNDYLSIGYSFFSINKSDIMGVKSIETDFIYYEF